MNIGGLFEKTITQETTNLADYDLTDASANAGDGSLVTSGGSTVNITNTMQDGGATQGAVDIAGMALGTAVNAQTLAAHAIAGSVISQQINADLAGGIGKTSENLFTTASDNQLAALTALGRQQTDALRDALDAAKSSQQAANTFAANAAADAQAMSRAAISQAAGVASDALSSNERALMRSLGFADDSLIAVGNSQRQAFGFADTSLLAVSEAQRKSFGFAESAMAESVIANSRSVTTAENALDTALAFARQGEASNNSLLGDTLNSVLGLVKSTAIATQSEAEATRDFAGQFVGDFYESQKSGDVQTIQNIAKYAGVVGVALALAWALKGKA